MRVRCSPATRSASRRCAIWSSTCSVGLPAPQRRGNRCALISAATAQPSFSAFPGGLAIAILAWPATALGRDGCGFAVFAQPCCLGARQRGRRGRGLSRDRVAVLGCRRCEHGSADRPSCLRRGVRRPGVAHCASVGPPPGGRALRIPHRKWTERAARQRTRRTHHGSPRSDPWRAAARSRPRQRRHDRRRSRQRMGGIHRCRGPASQCSRNG